MNILLWSLQGLLAIHTVMGAIWKFSHTAEETMPSLQAIPQSLWMGLIVVEVLCAVGLVLPAVHRPFPYLVPMAAGCVAIEMFLFSGVHLAARTSNNGPIGYWLIVAALCVLVVFGRLRLSPL